MNEKFCKIIGFIHVFILFLTFSIFAQQDIETVRRDTILYGTETEIASLIQALRSENVHYLDDELITLAGSSRNHRILTGIFTFFGEREKEGLDEYAIRIVANRQDEVNETVMSAIDYLGRIRSAEAVPVIMDLLDTEERRFLSTGFRAIGLASSANQELADETAQYLVDFYNFRDPGNDNRSVVIAAIGDTGSSLGVSFLADIVTNTDERIPLRIAALGALSKIGDEEGLDAILSCITTNDPNVRSAAVSALGPFSGDTVDNAILEAFRDSYYRTRIAAAQASRERRLEDAVPFLRFRAERDEVPNVKEESIRALGAIANTEAIEVLNNLFSERRNPDNVRIISAEMLVKIDATSFFERVVIELDEARVRNQTNLSNGFLRVVGETIANGDTSSIENIARRFLHNGTIIEKSYALDMALNNKLIGLSEEIITLTKDRNESLARKAQRIAQTLEIEIPED